MEKQESVLSITKNGDILTAAITANSTAPTGLLAGGYRIAKNGKICRLTVFAQWGAAGTTNTTATFNLAAVMAEIPGIVSQFNKVAGQCVANDAVAGTALLDKNAETVVCTFASASLESVEAHFVFECE